MELDDVLRKCPHFIGDGVAGSAVPFVMQDD